MYENYIKKLEKEIAIRNLKDTTLENYKLNIKKFLEWCGKEPDDVTLDDAFNYIYEVRVNRKMSSQYCNCIHSSLKFFFRHILKKSWDQDAVPRMINDMKLPEVLPLESIEAMIETCTEVRNKAIISLLYSSGLRVGELCRLAPGDIYMSTMQVHIRNSKNHWDHWTILSQKSLDFLSEYWRSYPVQRDYLFVSLRDPHEPLHVCGIQAMVKKIGLEAGVNNVHPHTLRHSFATHMIEQDVPLEYIQSMLGHRNANSTHKYIHVSNKSLMGIKSPLDHPATKKRGRKKKNEQ